MIDYPSQHEEWTQTKTSQILNHLADLGDRDDISLEEVLTYLRGRAFGMMLVLMAVLSLIPNLFGHTILTGLLIVTLGLQMLLGRYRVSLPKKIMSKRFPRSSIHAAAKKVSPWIERMETFLRPRLIFMTEDVGRRLLGLLLIPLGLLIALPLPLTNFWPALTLLLLSLGLIEKDGVAIILGLIMSTGAAYIIFKIIDLFLGA